MRFNSNGAQHPTLQFLTNHINTHIMKKFEALPVEKKEANKLITNDGPAYEVAYVIIANDEDRARELLEIEGEDPDNFTLSSVPGVKDQLGRYYPESIRPGV